MIVFIFVTLVLLAYLGLNLRSIVESQTFVDNWTFVKGIISTVWLDYLKQPVVYLFTKVFLPYIWEPSIRYLSSQIGSS